MPYTEKQKRAMAAEYGRRKSGKKPWKFQGMSMEELRKHIKMPLKK